MGETTQLFIVFVAALATALATGLGALPLLRLRDATSRVLGNANAVAAGLMLAATQLLVVEGWAIDRTGTVYGAIGGFIAIVLIAKVVHAGGEPDVGQLRGANPRIAFLIIAVMTAHSAAEGIGVGVSFGGGQDLGVLVTIAIAIHNIPEGLAIALVLVPRGSSVRAAAGWSIFSSLPQPLLAVPAFLFVEAFQGALPLGLGIAAGAMVWMVLSELLPEALEGAPRREVVAGTAVGYAIMYAITVVLGSG
jgi:zinc transporter, ZIP family